MSDDEKINTLNYYINRISRQKWKNFLYRFEDKNKDIENFIKHIDLNDLENILSNKIDEDENEFDHGYQNGYSDGKYDEKSNGIKYEFFYNKAKLRSFIKIILEKKIALVVGVEGFVDYMESSHLTAEAYFTEKGRIQSYFPTEIDMMKEIVILSKDEDWRFYTANTIIGKIMKKSGGRLNPNEIKRFLDDIGIHV